MLSIDAIIMARGGYEQLAKNPIRVENGPFMPLSIEVIGTGPRSGTLVAVHHSCGRIEVASITQRTTTGIWSLHGITAVAELK